MCGNNDRGFLRSSEGILDTSEIKRNHESINSPVDDGEKNKI